MASCFVGSVSLKGRVGVSSVCGRGVRRTSVVKMATSTGWGRTATEEELKTDLPKLFVYDHCQYCVRCRMVFGLRGEKYDLYFLSNDDAITPTKMIGKKVLPILSIGGNAMGESMDIIAKIEGDRPALKPATGRTDIKEWLAKTTGVQRMLTRPRLAKTPLAEFQTKSSRETYANNHKTYDEMLSKTDELLASFNESLKELEAMLDSDESVSPGGIGYDDIELFPRIRGITMVKGVEFPPKLKSYAEKMSERCDIPLFYYCAS
ncbi:hypothetical protein NDN08_001483 [Rhodosorus marinus]|uniref:GST N-terminal domain-containing protein n=1 Tax=Rhodosorus marinus TaxID=101924 RepID=A0AAV8UR05_9RHOD|nr:hypothetical protein NDN08_001483 [Rhodosorus marinus]